MPRLWPPWRPSADDGPPEPAEAPAGAEQAEGSVSELAGAAPEPEAAVASEQAAGAEPAAALPQAPTPPFELLEPEQTYHAQLRPQGLVQCPLCGMIGRPQYLFFWRGTWYCGFHHIVAQMDEELRSLGVSHYRRVNATAALRFAREALMVQPGPAAPQ